jgi:hypothetical protein
MINYDITYVKNNITSHLNQLIESLTFEDSLDEAAYRATAQLKVTPDLSAINGQIVSVDGIPFNSSAGAMDHLLSPGVIWGTNKSKNGQFITLTIYDRLIYLLKSDDEYLFASGLTASQRLKRIAADWGIPLGTIANTKTLLAKGVYRAKNLFAIIREDLQETVAKGGEMYFPRMTPDGLNLIKIGSNNVWRIEACTDLSEDTTLDGVITKVKITGNAKDGVRSPVVAVVTGDTEIYGTIQKVIHAPKTISAATAKSKAKLCLKTPSIYYNFSTIDINTMRAGDIFKLNDLDLIVASITHNCGAPGQMQIRAADADTIRSDYYMQFGKDDWYE